MKYLRTIKDVRNLTHGDNFMLQCPKTKIVYKLRVYQICDSDYYYFYTSQGRHVQRTNEQSITRFYFSRTAFYNTVFIDQAFKIF